MNESETSTDAWMFKKSINCCYSLKNINIYIYINIKYKKRKRIDYIIYSYIMKILFNHDYFFDNYSSQEIPHDNPACTNVATLFVQRGYQTTAFNLN